MQRSDRKPNASLLSRFDRLAHLDPQRLETLATRLQVLEAGRGTTLVELGSRDADTVFLISGQVRLEAEDGQTRFISESDPAAHRPLCHLRPSHWRALAAGPVRYLRIPDELIDALLDDVPLAGYEVTELGSDLEELATETGEILLRLVDELQRRRLVVPSLPEVARLTAGRVLAAGEDAVAMAEALALDPSLALKVVHLANAGHPAASPVRSARAAVERIGTERARDLAVHCAFLETFRCTDAGLRTRFEHWWRESLLTAILARHLAGMAAGVDAATAELVGLTHGIGHAVLLHHCAGLVENHPERIPLNGTFARDAAYIGGLVLHRWQLPPEVATAADQARDPFRDHGGHVDHGDILLVARRIAAGNHLPADTAPALGLMPAARRIHADLMNANYVAELRTRAVQRVEAVAAALGG